MKEADQRRENAGISRIERGREEKENEGKKSGTEKRKKRREKEP